MNLTNSFQEEQFAKEFLNRDGLYELIGVINTSHGNILAVRLSIFPMHLEKVEPTLLSVCPYCHAESNGARLRLVQPRE